MLRSLLFCLSFAFVAACATNTETVAIETPQSAPMAETGQVAAPASAAYYPLETCIVSGKPLGQDSVWFVVDGRTFKTCCESCRAKVIHDPTTYAKKLDEATIRAQLPNYPLTTCPISGSKLGDMGESVQLVLEGTLVQLCCEHCTKKAMDNADMLAQRVRQAAFEQQLANYPMTTCPISGKPLTSDATATMFGTTLVRTCCSKCADEIGRNPAPFLARLDAARAAAKAEKPNASKPSTDKAAGKPTPKANATNATTPTTNGTAPNTATTSGTAQPAPTTGTTQGIQNPTANPTAPAPAGGTTAAPTKPGTIAPTPKPVPKPTTANSGTTTIGRS